MTCRILIWEEGGLGLRADRKKTHIPSNRMLQKSCAEQSMEKEGPTLHLWRDCSWEHGHS